MCGGDFVEVYNDPNQVGKEISVIIVGFLYLNIVIDAND